MLCVQIGLPVHLLSFAHNKIISGLSSNALTKQKLPCEKMRIRRWSQFQICGKVLTSTVTWGPSDWNGQSGWWGDKDKSEILKISKAQICMNPTRGWKAHTSSGGQHRKINTTNVKSLNSRLVWRSRRDQMWNQLVAPHLLPVRLSSPPNKPI